MPDRGAARVVATLRAQLPDLRDAVVLVPDLHAATAVARALSCAADVPMLLLPSITTLEEWASGVALDRPVAARSAREATLYAALAARPWLRDADLWSMAAELTCLFDELIRHNVALAHDLDDFAAKLEAAYRARPSASLRFEAQLVHELWWAMSRDPAELAPAAAYQLRLARAGGSRVTAGFRHGPWRVSRPPNTLFSSDTPRRAPVTVLDAPPDASDPLAATLAAAWQTDRDAELRVRARDLRAAHGASALASRLRVFGAASAEQEAQAIDVTVREWLLAGKRSIAVVLQDRVVARRARALLERAAVLAVDEAGWALSTTSAATALGRWLDIVANDAYHQDLLDLMKSPFAFHDRPREQRRDAVWRLERYVREANVVAGGERYLALAQGRGDTEVTQLLRRVQRGLAALPSHRKPLAGCLQRSTRACRRSACARASKPIQRGSSCWICSPSLRASSQATTCFFRSASGGAGSPASSKRLRFTTAASKARWSSPILRPHACAASTRSSFAAAMRSTFRVRNRYRGYSIRACARISACPRGPTSCAISRLSLPR
jgi:ATP-dependent helicase/nuclease subunit B